MADAQCLCGALKLKSQEPSKLTVACHCFACQRRTGNPFSVGAFYAIDAVEISGAATEFVHVGDSGRRVCIYFCPTCGSTVYWKPDALPSMIGVAVGALAAPDFPAPVLSVFERSKHHWVQLDGEVEHLHEGAMRKYGPDLEQIAGRLGQAARVKMLVKQKATAFCVPAGTQNAVTRGSDSR